MGGGSLPSCPSDVQPQFNFQLLSLDFITLEEENGLWQIASNVFFPSLPVGKCFMIHSGQGVRGAGDTGRGFLLRHLPHGDSVQIWSLTL